MRTSPNSQSQVAAWNLSGKLLAGGRYEVVSQLGGGSMGFVYRATDRNLNAPVVIKTPTLARLENAGFRRRFTQESQFLVSLRHPHVITIMDVGEEDGIPFFVMQFVGGGSLEDKQRRQGKRMPMSRSSLRHWLPQIAAALDFIHAQGYVHRDIKPGNILFDTHRNPYLSDFGLSKLLTAEAETDSGQTAAGAVVGTPNYVAPEIVLGREFDGQADQYSLAITVFEVLTGKAPFEGPSASATMVNQVSQKAPNPAEINPRISESLAEVILKGMAKRRSSRFDSCTEFADAVLRAADRSDNSSSESWLASGTTHFVDVPEFLSQGKAKIAQGRVSCLGCQTRLLIKSAYAGRKGKCNQCGMRMSISKNLKNVEFFVPFDADSKPSASADREFSLIFSQKAFGMEFDISTALIIIAGLLVMIIVGGTLALTMAQYDPDMEMQRKTDTTKIRSEQ